MCGIGVLKNVFLISVMYKICGKFPEIGHLQGVETLTLTLYFWVASQGNRLIDIRKCFTVVDFLASC